MAVCISRSGDRSYGLISVSQQLIWRQLILIYCWDYVQLVAYQTTSNDDGVELH